MDHAERHEQLMSEYWMACFEKYGQHLPNCLKTIPRKRSDRRRFDCTCGFEGALRTGNLPVPEIRKIIPTHPQLVRLSQEVDLLNERAELLGLLEADGEVVVRKR